MKDYTIDKELKKTFILNYEIKEGKIIVFLASKEKYILPDTRENELTVLKAMKKQVKHYLKRKETMERFQMFGGKCILVGLLACVGIFSFTNPIYVMASFVFFLLAQIIGIGSIIEFTKELKDLEKNELFLEYEKQINTNEEYQSEKTRNKKQQLVEKINQAMPKTIETYVEERLAPIESPEVPLFNLNTIDKISYKELKELTDLIDLDEKFHPAVDLPKELIKRQKNK